MKNHLMTYCVSCFVVALFVVLGEGCSPSREAVAAMETFEHMLQQSETDAHSRCVWPGEKACDDAEREYAFVRILQSSIERSDARKRQPRRTVRRRLF